MPKDISRHGRQSKTLGGIVSILVLDTGHEIDADITITAALPI
jgi:hypothetical protein